MKIRWLERHVEVFPVFQLSPMDIFSHGLWVGAAYKAINKKVEKPFNVWLAGFWGVFPDLFAFTIPFIWIFWNIAFGDLSFTDLPHRGDVEPVPQNTLPIFRLTGILYSISHSVIVFLVVLGAIILVSRFIVSSSKRTPLQSSSQNPPPISTRLGWIRWVPWEIGGWFLHILLDIPTHSYQFYPTPFLWPLSDWTLGGFSWGTPWFLIPNYAAIILIFILLRRKKIFHVASP